MDILLDLNIILDLLIPQRKGYHPARKINNIIKEKNYSKWISASSIDNIHYILLSEAKRFDLRYADKIGLEFNKYLTETKIFSVTGDSIRKALQAEDLEDHILYTNFKRIAPDGIIISGDKRFKTYPDVLSIDDFFEKHDIVSSKQPALPISFLDLKEEYRYMLEGVDGAVLKNIADARYILGPEVKMFEDKVAEYLGVKHCIGCSSGTDALVLSLRAMAIKLKEREYFDKSDYIITTPFTFTATGDAILRAGATPLFVDIDPATYNIDPVKIRECLASYVSNIMPHPSRIVGIIPVHLYGQACNMDEIMEIAKENNLFVLEDVAQAFGGMWKGRKLGSIGDAGAFSFFPSKNLGGFGDGGMVSTNDDEIAELVRMLLKHGGRDKYNVDHIGYNARLDTLQAAILLAKFKYIDEFNTKRRGIAGAYNEGFRTNNKITVPESLKDSHHVYHQYTIRVKDGKREALQKYLHEKGVSTMIYYPVPLHRMKVFGDGRCKIAGGLQNSEESTLGVISLPVEPLQSENVTAYVVDSVNKFD